MSILTSDDPNKALRLIKKLIQFNIVLSIVSYATGLAFLFYLINDPFHSSFSDNSLLPGLANREFVDSELAKKHLLQLNNVTAELDPLNRLPLSYLKKQFEEIGLEVYEHQFRFNPPFGYPKQPVNGTNLYAVLRAPRATSTESIVISVPYRSRWHPHGSTLPSIALMLSLAKFFNTQSYWAKDVIFLISQSELLGMQAWLQAYQGFDKNPHLESDILISKAGIIHAAINLELKSFTPQYVQLRIEGLNGQLPNLDLFNVAVELCNRESVPVVFHGDSFYVTDNNFEDWMRKARTMISMMVSQATMLPTGAHGLFQKYAISSITLEAPDIKPRYLMVDALSLGRSIEGIVRSLNNMMEKFNRGFFFYILVSTRRFISISLYMIVFGFLAIPLAFKSLHYYFRSSSKSSTSSDFDVWASFKPCFLSHLYGILVIGIVPLVLTKLDDILFGPLEKFISSRAETENLAYGILIAIAVISLKPLAMTNQIRSTSQYCLQSMMVLLNALLLFTSISLINISLAFALTLIYVPLLTVFSIQDHLVMSVPHNRLKVIGRILKLIILFMIHPIILHLICLFIFSIWSDLAVEAKPNNINEWIWLAWQHLFLAAKAQPKILLKFIEDWYLYDNWAFPMAALFVFPVWLQLWFQATTVVIDRH